jgi:hypothetical protein
MTKNLTFHALGMIPTYLEITAAQLHESLEQLKHLEPCKNKPYILDDEIVDRIIKLYSEKSELVAAGLQQCKFWRDQNPTSIQLADIEKIEKFSKRLQKTSEQILFLARHYKDHTINRILEKDDVELALDYLLGNLYDPLDLDEEEVEETDQEPLGTGSLHDFQIFNNPNEKGIKALYKIKVNYHTQKLEFLSKIYQDYAHERRILNELLKLSFDECMEDTVDISKELGNFDSLEETAVIQNDSEMNVFYDYATLYRGTKNKRFITDWFERNSNVITSSNKKVAQIYADARFSLLRIDHNLSHGAIQVVDVITQNSYLLIDKALNASKHEGLFFCCSIMDMGDYIMTTGGGIPIDGRSPGGKAILTLIINQLNDLKSPAVYTPEVARCVKRVYGFCLRNSALSGMTPNEDF